MADPYAGQPYIEPGIAIQQLNFLAGISKPELIELIHRLRARDCICMTERCSASKTRAIDYVWLLLEGKISQYRRDLDPEGKPRQSLVREAEAGTPDRRLRLSYLRRRIAHAPWRWVLVACWQSTPLP